jgi:protein-tyrosine phosphatase
VRWLEFDSLVNARDVGGTPTVDGGVIRPGRLIRADNLQELTARDVERLLRLGVSDVVDLRSAYEVHHEGPGPLVGNPAVRIHHYSYIPERYDRREENDTVDVLPDNQSDNGARLNRVGRELPGNALPFVGHKPSIKVDDAFASTYLSFLNERPESVLASLRTIAGASGTALVHCAAGKDRTGTAVALSLLLAGAEPEAVIEDYAASSERMQQIIDRLAGRDTYRENMINRPLESHMTRPETMRAFFAYADAEHGGIEPMLRRMGWTDTDTAAMRTKLRGP